MNDRHNPNRQSSTPEESTSLDRAIEATKNETADPETARAAASRVLQRLSAESTATTGGSGSGSIHGCEGFVELMPALLSGALTESRRILLEDHTRECVNCRRELQRLRRGEPVVGKAAVVSLESRRARIAVPRWALAAGISALLVAGFAASRFLPWGSVDARVASIQGELFDDGNRSIVAGATLGRGDVVRTARNSGAVLELADGSRFELAERSELRLGRRRDGVMLDLSRGGLIVEAARQSGGDHLYVKTGDVTVAVTGTVFSVNHGIKGSRVSVLDGEVRVSQSGRSGPSNDRAGFVPAVLRPGDQYVSRADLARVPLDRDVSWSRDAARYRREIAALKTVGREIDQALASPLRTSTRLLDLAPVGTVVYLAAPNVGPSLGSAWDRLQSQAAQNPAFAAWWNRQVGPHEAEIEELISELREIGSGLGAEVAMTIDGGLGAQSPLMLAEVPNPTAFSPILDEKIAHFNERMSQEPGERPRLRRIQSVPANAAENEVLVWLRGDLLLVATDPARLAAVDAAASGPNPFVGTSFHGRIAAIYAEGAGWVGAIDAQRFTAMNERQMAEHGRQHLEASGLAEVEAVVFNATTGDAGAGGSTRALISFAGARRGIASWLAAPASSGALEFVSPDAHLAFGALLKRPVDMFDDLIGLTQNQDGSATEAMAKFEREHGVALREDLAAALGGDVAFAFDGPWLPQPTWKLVVEVVDPSGLQSTIERLVTEWNAGNAEKVRLVLTQEAAGNRPVYRLDAVPADPANGEAPRATAFYLYEDGYLVAGPNRALLLEAITQRNAGITLQSAQRFNELLPSDGHVHFSAVAYQDLGAVSGLLGQWLGAAQGMSAEQRKELENLAQGTASLMVAYGEENAIEIAGRTNDGPFGMGFQKLLGLTALQSQEERASGARARGGAQEAPASSRRPTA